MGELRRADRRGDTGRLAAVARGAVHAVRGDSGLRLAGEALELANGLVFGLTAGLYAEDPAEIEHFEREIKAGVIYVNREAGATTGAWPGIQSFGGWEGSGSTGRGAGGIHYLQQYMREQSLTVVGG